MRGRAVHRGGLSINCFTPEPGKPPGNYSFTGTAPAVRMRSAASLLVAKSTKGLCLLRQGHALVGDEHEGTLDLVAAVLHGVLAALHTLHGDHGNGVAHSGQGSVADGQRIGLHSADDCAGSGQLLCVLAAVLHVHDALKAIAGAGTGLAAHQNDLAVVAAHILPVGDLAGEHLLQLVHGQVCHLAGLVDNNGDAVQSHGGAVHVVLLVVLQGAGGQADVQRLIGSAGDACAGTGGVVADGDTRLHLGKALGQGCDDVLHRGRTTGSHIAGQGACSGLSSGRRRGGLRSRGCHSGRGCAAAGGQSHSRSSSAADSDKRTTSDLFITLFLNKCRNAVPADVLVCFPWERPNCTAPPCALRPCTRKMEVKLLHRLRLLCQACVKPA